MKRVLAIVLALTLLMMCAGCGSKENADAPEKDPVSSGETAGTTEEPIELKMWTFLNPNGGTSPVNWHWLRSLRILRQPTPISRLTPKAFPST